MPTPPAATVAQQSTIEAFVTLATTEAASISNQIAVLDQSLASFSEARTFYQGRYDFWDQYISALASERRYLDGYYQTAPLTLGDFTTLQANSGRLFSISQPDPIRISEFDGVGSSATDGAAETLQYGPEATLRATLVTGFAGVALPLGLQSLEALTPASTTLEVNVLPGGTQVVIPLGKTVIQDGSNRALVQITAVTENLLIPFPAFYSYTLQITILALTGTVAIGALFTPNFPGFSESERSSLTAAVPAYQGVLTDLRSRYLAYITAFRDALNQQGLAIATQTNEDAPDAPYGTARTQAQADLSQYLVAGSVGNAGLAVVQGVLDVRTVAAPARTTWIAGRISTADAYGERYRQATRLHNRNDGGETLYLKTTAQKATLLTQQTASNARAANLTADLS